MQQQLQIAIGGFVIQIAGLQAQVDDLAKQLAAEKENHQATDAARRSAEAQYANGVAAMQKDKARKK